MRRIPVLEERQIAYRWVGLSAVEEYLGARPAPQRFALVAADLVELAPLFPDQRYVGLAEFDLAIDDEIGTVYMRCVDGFDGAGGPRASDRRAGVAPAAWTASTHVAPRSGPASGEELLALQLDPTRRHFKGTVDAASGALYPLLRTLLGRRRRAFNGATSLTTARPAAAPPANASCAGAVPTGAATTTDYRGAVSAALDLHEKPVVVPPQDSGWAAVLAARLDIAYTPAEPHDEQLRPPTRPPNEWWRVLLSLILGGEYAWRGLEVLMRTGVINRVLPELQAMDQTDQSKEGHPEGNVWRHTLESLRYRKQPNELVSLALLFHDMGKPVAAPQGQNRFHRHAELGAIAAARAMRRLEYPQETIDAVHWLIRNHMIPGALEMLPESRRGPIMASPLFPLLLEIYRCDLSSTYRSPEGYYSACRIYRRFLKHAANPYRSDEGKRLIKMYVA